MQWHVCCDNEVWGYSLVLLIHGFAQNGSTIWIIGKRKQAHSVGHTSRPIPLKEQHWDSCGGDGSALDRPKKFKVSKAMVSFQNCPEYPHPHLQSNFVNTFSQCSVFVLLPSVWENFSCWHKIDKFPPPPHNFRRYCFLKKKHDMSHVFSIKIYIFQTNVLDQKFFSYHSFVSTGVWALSPCHPDIGWQHDNLDYAW